MSNSRSDHGNLVLSFVGDQSVHPTWLGGSTGQNGATGLEGSEPRRFDLALVYFGDDPSHRERQECDFYLAEKGFKYWRLKELAATKLRDLLARYERVWLPDDDIAADTPRINRLFDLFEKYRLQIAQPAIAAGEVSYNALCVDPRFEVRFTGYAEVMCPLFRREALQRCLPTFQESRSSWGLDWLWASLYSKREIGVIDAVGVEHTRPLATGSLYQKLAKMGVTPGDEFRAIRRRHGIRKRGYRRALLNGTARVRGVTAEGTEMWNRPLLEGWLGRRQAA
ncbi:hypothetical protein Pla108_34500 [Botrimarina colliarenosi]|uniref:DUF707 domain-containing protein n=1 Tax=Botrimarina colliarenosi TaxID=2528001 RepID=A0A5C6A7K9_9BACT|nr:hypothetical protein [Botrimarina colliarenosi]TWT95305.1 hypothetical protein Pla108_34500 [Botrimarina colliarenosi]